MKVVVLQGVMYQFTLICTHLFYNAKPVFINMHKFLKTVTHHELCCF